MVVFQGGVGAALGPTLGSVVHWTLMCWTVEEILFEEDPMA